MHFQFEESDSLNTPIECFYYDNQKNKFPVEPHWHYFMEIIYMLEGTAQMIADDSTYLLQPGDLILFHPKVVHAIYEIEPAPLRYAVIKLDLNCLTPTLEYAPKLKSLFHHAEKKQMPIYFTAQQTKALHLNETFSSCIQEMNTQTYGFDLVVRSKIYEFLIKLIRTWLDLGFTIDTEVYHEDETTKISNVTEYIEKHIEEGIHVSEIAKACNMSYSNFTKNFTALYGKTCKEYIEEVRILKVERFLLFTDFDLTYISHETGYSDCSHMIKSFKSKKGITPKQYRLQNQLHP